ncbi:MAG TPA: hypothetical protein VHQ03_09710, partial [Candidatus Dormibacteraeota bacterium]|nr:hypothetical protein [Candidatus Dormibacteraeota bacterium]
TPETRRLIPLTMGPALRLASRVSQSARVIAVEWILIKTRPGPAEGFATSAIRQTSGGPYLS